MTCQPSSTSYRNPKDLLGKIDYAKETENDELANHFTDSIISNHLFDEIFADFNAKEKYNFTIDTNENKRIRPREDDAFEFSHSNKKRKVINDASDMLLEVRESYAYVQGADMYNDTSQQFFSNVHNAEDQNIQKCLPDKTFENIPNQELETKYQIKSENEWERKNPLLIDIDKCSSNQSRPSCSPDQSDNTLFNPPSSPQNPTSFKSYNYQGNNFIQDYQTRNSFKSCDSQTDSNSPVKLQPSSESDVCHLLNNRSSGFLTHPLYNLLRDLIIADMNFSNPSFPFDLILHLPETFERLLHNYFTRNPGISLANVHPLAHSILLDSLKEAHNSLILKIQARKLAEGIPILPQRRLSQKQAAELTAYLYINDNFNSGLNLGGEGISNCSINNFNSLNVNTNSSVNNINENSMGSLSLGSKGIVQNGSTSINCGISDPITGNVYGPNYPLPSKLKVPNSSPYINNGLLNNPLSKHLNGPMNIPNNNTSSHLLTSNINAGHIHSPSNRHFPPMHPYPPYKLYNHYSPDRFNSAMPPHPSSPQILPPYPMNCNPANPHMMMLMESGRRVSNSPRKFTRLMPNDNPTEKTGKNKVLPKEAVNKMMEWLKEHEDNPYPNDDQKEQLVAETKLSINQINYWFTNARRRVLPKWAHQKHIDEQERLRNMAKNGDKTSCNLSSASEISSLNGKNRSENIKA